MLLCDIGNSFAKFYDGKRLERLPVSQIDCYKERKVCYINVNPCAQEHLATFEKWIDVEPFIDLDTRYQGLGVDRKMLCWGIEDGVVVDAGSAITVDVMRDGKHLGGFIMPGLRFLLQDYAQISARLAQEKLCEVDLASLPHNTGEAISYGVIKPIVLAIRECGEDIYLTGGDGQLLHRYIPEAHYDGLLLFRHFKRLVQRNSIC